MREADGVKRKTKGKGELGDANVLTECALIVLNALDFASMNLSMIYSYILTSLKLEVSARFNIR